MKHEEAWTLKIGDLVVINHKLDRHHGWVFEIEDITKRDNYGLLVTLKQPCYDGGFRMYNYDTRRLKRYEEL